MKFFNSKVDARQHGGPKSRIFRYHRNVAGAPKFYVPSHSTQRLVGGSDDPPPHESIVPKEIAVFSHCLMDSGNDNGNGTMVSPIVFDIDAKAKRQFSQLLGLREVQTAVRFAVFVFVKVLVEYVVRNSSISSSRVTPMPEFWMSDASGARTSNNQTRDNTDEEKYKFSYHLLMRFPPGEDGKVTNTFQRSSSLALCKLLNKCMRAQRITFRLPGVPENETKALHSVMVAMRATLFAEMADDDLKGGIFDEQIYKSNSLRILGAQRPSGGSELVHVDTDTGCLSDSIWNMDPQRRTLLQRMHDPYPSIAELETEPGAIVPCNTIPPRIIDSDDDDDDDEDEDNANGGMDKRKSVSEMAAMQITTRLVPKQKFSISRTTLALDQMVDGGGSDGTTGSNHIRDQMTRLCTTVFRTCCKEAIPGSELPSGYKYKFKNVKLCRNNNGLEQSLVISLDHADYHNQGTSTHQSLHLGQRHYYSVQAQLPFCPWKSTRCRCNGVASSDHNQRRVQLEIHPKGEHSDAFVEIRCFSAKCVAGMPPERKLRVAIARYPPAIQGERRPVMVFSEAVFEFDKLALNSFWRGRATT